jgi:hypothetical protein
MRTRGGINLGWTYIGLTTKDSFIIDGTDVFKEEWKDTGEIANVVDPAYGQKFEFTVWQVKTAQKMITFAAGEFSNNVWGIYRNS